MGNISNWTEGILFALAFIAILGVIVADFNHRYNQSYDLGLTDNETEQRFIDYQGSAEQNIKGGEVEFDSEQGISLKSSYGLVTDAMDIIWQFLSGGFVENLINKLNLGSSGVIFARVLRIVWFLSVVFALLYALFKVVM